MRFSTQTLIALLASPLLAFAASENKFTNSDYNGITAGQTFNIKWDPTTSGTVSLILRSGASNNLTPGVYVAQGISNSGSYSWSVPSDITRGSDYALEIVDDSDPSNVNYTPQFVVDSTNTVASSTSYISQSASASSASGSASSSASSVSRSASSSAASGSSSASSASGSASSSASSASRSASSSASSASSSAASRASSASSSAAPTSTGGAMASAIPFGLLALGALAL
ncbi:hypothetical protein E4T39_01091 [Aureobasidium subglaciale]|nr:hypothetical protein E4T39_01091 [Aureobasidium subglaciale]